MATLGDKKRAEAIAEKSKPVFWKAGAWSFGLSHGYEWILSAQLCPQGRGSKESDWKFLGEMAGAVGAPVESLVTPFDETHPNDTHYWIWPSETCPEELREQVVQIARDAVLTGKQFARESRGTS